MKKIICLFLCFVFSVFSFTACKKSPADDTASHSSSTAVSSVNSVKTNELKPEQESFKYGDVLNGKNGLISNLAYITEERLANNKIELRADLSGI